MEISSAMGELRRRWTHHKPDYIHHVPYDSGRRIPPLVEVGLSQHRICHSWVQVSGTFPEFFAFRRVQLLVNFSQSPRFLHEKQLK